ncbi:hypothetical protein SAMN05444722_3560 [Rhodovulum sp. ES.010]|uniref:hypothetical protein n=1 Tax=Rhodovulum sp. ES.010 TaxID=1882821 RepID=UPI00092B0280|nr:hypothetical protein [Rhodovulum sp. ES.010]SIO56053.1 hypothetical protein SAMN05444722_3560 [Rhodovulum sp. ES.010]
MFPFKPGGLAVLLGAGVLASCGPEQMKTLRQAETALIGEDASVLAACIGAPVAVRDAPDGVGKVHAFSSAQARGADGTLRAAPRPKAESRATACVIEFAVADGRIRAMDVENRGGWGGGRIKRCAAIVRRCGPQ